MRKHNPYRERISYVAALALLLLPTVTAARYSARRSGDVVQLEDTTTQTVVSIVPSVGNIAFEMKVKGQNVLRWPFASVEEFKAKPALSGIPFLGPWANRLDEQAFYANGQKYAFDMELGNVRGAIPIHGFMTTTNQWQLLEARVDDKSAWVTSRLEAFRQPMWMKQFPFAHAIEMTYRLKDGVLEVSTRIQNMSADPMPVAIGFHPYFQLTDSRREEWAIAVGARTEWILAPNKVPTGETRPIEQFLHDPTSVPLKDFDLDHVFGDLIRDGSGRAIMTLKGKQQKLDVLLGAKYRAVVIWAPQPNAATPAVNRNFVCFEPMAAITDALNLSQRGLYRELQSIPPGQTWQESFWVRPAGF